MQRQALRDDQCDHIKDLLPGRPGSVGATAADDRRFVEFDADYILAPRMGHPLE